MTLGEAIRHVCELTGTGTDGWEKSHLDILRELAPTSCGHASDMQLKKMVVNMRKKGLVGPVLGGKGPTKLRDMVCPHCGRKYFD